MPEYLVDIRWKPNKAHRMILPYVPRVGDVLKIYNDDYDNEKEIASGEVYKVIFYSNADTVHAGEPNFDIYIK